jgi:hypothetical protein
MKLNKVTIVILTYKRNELLVNLIELFNTLSVKFSIDIYIFDNLPTNDLDLSNYSFNNVRINYFKRAKNLGPVLNYFESLHEVSKKITTKYISIITDDDLITYEYLNKLNALENENDEFDYVLFNNLLLFNEKIKKYKIRKYNVEYLEILDKHTTITGTTYSRIYLNNFFSLNFIKNINLDMFMYPMTFTFLFSKNFKIINEPCLIHRTENETHWGNYNHFEKFYLYRLKMYEIAYQENFICYNEYFNLTKRLIVRAPINYYFKLYIYYNLSFKKKLPQFFIELLYNRLIILFINIAKKYLINDKN